MIVNDKIIEEKRFEVVKFLGEWSTDHFEIFFQRLLRKQDFRLVDKFLVDLRFVNLRPAGNDFSSVIHIIENLPKKEYLVVHLVDQPFSTAKVHLFLDDLMEKGFNFMYCSTVEYALKLLKLDFTENEMNDILKNLVQPVE